MKLAILRSKEIEQIKWDNFIYQSCEGNLFATYTYLQACERDWKATILYDEQGNYRAVMPFQIRKSYGITYIYQDPFSRELGIFAKDKLSHAECTALLKTTFISCRYVARYHFNVDNYADLQHINYLIRGKLSETYTYHLDLSQPYNDIQKNYRKDRRYSIRRAKRCTQNIYQSGDLEPALDIFKAFTFYRIPGLEPYQIDLKRKLYTVLFEKGIIDIHYVALDKMPIAAAVIAKYKRKITCLFTTNNEEAFELRSASLLLDHIIKRYAGKDLIFDFKGGGVESLDNFFSSFGAERKKIYTYRQNNLPFLIKLVNRGKKLLQK